MSEVIAFFSCHWRNVPEGDSVLYRSVTFGCAIASHQGHKHITDLASQSMTKWYNYFSWTSGYLLDSGMIYESQKRWY